MKYLILLLLLLISCGPYTSPGWENLKKIDHEKYAGCVMNAMTEARDLDLIKKECEEHAEIK